MQGKVLVIAAASCALLYATGCVSPKSVQPAVTAPSPTAAPASAAQPTAEKKASARSKSLARATPAPTPSTRAPQITSLIDAQITFLEGGQSLLVVRHGADEESTVPLFRQAVVLGAVRGAVAGAPAAPKAEWKNGLINLSFSQGTPTQIATAINRALALTEVQRLKVNLP